MAKKPTLVKVTANTDFEVAKDAEGAMRLWGVDFQAKDGKLTAEMSKDEAEAMIEAGRAS